MEPFSKSAFIASKIIADLQQFDRTIAQWKFKQERIVFTNGCFDLIHRGHVDYLNKAAELGDKLVVGLNSDASVKQLGKGVLRPIQDEYSRALILASMHYIDAVIVFNENTPLELITRIQPHVLVKGGDWPLNQIVGSDLVQSYGGTVCTIPFLDGYSSTQIEQYILRHG